MVASKPAQGDVPSREGGHHPLPLPRLGHPLTLAVHRRGHPSSLTGACGEPGASKGACRVREAVRGNGPAARWAPRPGPTFTDRPQPLIVVFITGHADRVSVDGLRYGGRADLPSAHRARRADRPQHLLRRGQPAPPARPKACPGSTSATGRAPEREPALPAAGPAGSGASVTATTRRVQAAEQQHGGLHP
jgi:hypothetical protein